MSDEELQRLVEQNLVSTSVSKQTGLKVAQKIKEIADRENVKFMIAGGLAMHLYGFERATKDVDFISDKRISLQVKRFLSFGGERYEIEIEGEKIDVDWIIRRDKYKAFYDLALAETKLLTNEIQILTPEWLVILKYIAGRAKDRIDLIWLLQQPNSVNRKKVKDNIEKVVGKLGATGFLLGLQREFDLADVMGLRGNGDENESYISDEGEDYPNYNQ